MLNYIKKRICDVRNSLFYKEKPNQQSNIFYSGQLYEIQNLLEEHIKEYIQVKKEKIK